LIIFGASNLKSMEAQNVEKKYDVYKFDPYWKYVVKHVLEICDDPNVILGIYNASANETMFNKDIRFSLMIPRDIRSKYQTLIEEVDWQDEDCYYIAPNDEHYKKTEAIKADLKRFLEISEELDKIVAKYV
jgi:hypothetical protein